MATGRPTVSAIANLVRIVACEEQKCFLRNVFGSPDVSGYLVAEDALSQAPATINTRGGTHQLESTRHQSAIGTCFSAHASITAAVMSSARSV